MLSILIWTIYGIVVGSIAKALVPGEEKMGFLQTVALGVVGSYMGGSIMYLLGQYKAVSPAGIFVGIAGSVIALIVYKKLVSP